MPSWSFGSVSFMFLCRIDSFKYLRELYAKVLGVFIPLRLAGHRNVFDRLGRIQYSVIYSFLSIDPFSSKITRIEGFKR